MGTDVKNESVFYLFPYLSKKFPSKIQTRIT